MGCDSCSKLTMKRPFIILTIFLSLAATDNLDDEIIKDLDFFQEMELMQDKENLKLDSEEIQEVLQDEDKKDMEGEDERS